MARSRAFEQRLLPPRARAAGAPSATAGAGTPSRRRDPAQHLGLVGRLVVDTDQDRGRRRTAQRSPDEMRQRAGGVVTMDAIAPARRARRDDGSAAAHALDQARATRAVDATEAQHGRGAAALEQHALGLEHARAAELARRRLAGLVHPGAVVLRVDRRARGEEEVPRHRSARAQRREQIALTLDVGAPVRIVVAAVRRDGAHRRRRSAPRASRAPPPPTRGRRGRRAAQRRPPAIRPRCASGRSRGDPRRAAWRRARFRRSHSRRSGSAPTAQPP